MGFFKRSLIFTYAVTLLLAMGVNDRSFAQTPGTNNVRIRIPQIPVTDTAKLDTVPVQRQAVNIDYSDGLGRDLQSVQVQGSSGLMDIIMPYVYDNMGRMQVSYLAYADETTTTSTKGTLRAGAVNAELNFYNPASPGSPKIPTDAAPYTQTVYESSPLARVEVQGKEGSVFQPGTGHTTNISYQVNSATDGVNNYYNTVSGALSSFEVPFTAGVLAKTMVTDGNGHRVADWIDLQGRTVSETQLDAPTAYYSTDYIYNDLGQLSNIVTPTLKKQLAVSGTIAQSDFTAQAYIFHYDSIGRKVELKIPGKGWVYTIFNHSDKPVLVQDSNMRVKSQWYFMKYDAEGRVVETGIYINKSVTSRKALQYLCDNNFPMLWETWQPGTGYTNSAFPQQSAIPGASPLTLYTTYYYDDYSFTGASAKPFKTNIYNTTQTLRTMGRPTGKSVYLLGTASQQLVTVYFYDQQNRLIQLQKDNHLGQVDVINNQYNFIGQVVGIQRITTPISGSPITLKDRYVYDQLNRLLDTYESLNGSAEIDISHNVYNEIGQKVSEGLHSTNYNGSTGSFAQTQEFRYSIRQELTSINNGTLNNDGITQTDPNALFGETITYSETSPIGATPEYNGNISGMTWRNKIEQSGQSGLTTGGQGYAFSFDNVNRLTQDSYYTQSGNAFVKNTQNSLTENVKGYDEMSNIDTLQRRDKSGNLLNNLTYTYQSKSNQLSSINDAGSQNITGTYTYDGNGNMISDSRKGITMTYNYMNLLDTVKQGASKLVFTYDATGNKLYKQLITSGTVVSQRHYVEDVELIASTSVAYDGKVESIAMAEGRIVNTGTGGYKYEYYMQDHLFNNRVSFQVNTDGTLNLTTVQNYYPFGGDMGDATMNYSVSPLNLHKYEGKEMQPELGLDTYDFGARQYDPVLGRWMGIDPMAAEFSELSPYNYVENDPLYLTDPDGMQPNSGASTLLRYSTGNVASRAASQAAGLAAAGLTSIIQFANAYSKFNFKAPVSAHINSSLKHVQKNSIAANSGRSSVNGMVDIVAGFLGNTVGLRAMAVNLTLQSGDYINAAGNTRSFTTLAKYKPGVSIAEQGNLSEAFTNYRSLSSDLTFASRGLSAGLIAYDVISGQPTYKTEGDGVYWGISEVPFVGPPMGAFLFINSYIPVQYSTPFSPGRTQETWNSWVK